MTFEEWFKSSDENEEWLEDVLVHGDWNDLIEAIKVAYEAGFDKGRAESYK